MEKLFYDTGGTSTFYRFPEGKDWMIIRDHVVYQVQLDMRVLYGREVYFEEEAIELEKRLKAYLAAEHVT